MKLYYRLLELLFPSKCVLCRKLLKKEETDLCGCCRRETGEFLNRKTRIPFLDSFTAVWYYEKNVRSSLLRFKFYGARKYASCYGRHLAMKLTQTHQEEYDLVTWIPVSPLRKLRRGYDQANLLARSVGRELGMVPVSTLKKIRNNRRQSGIDDAAKRRANVLGVYRCVCPEQIAGKRILLLDDILTTGATASEAARVLKEKGAKEVHCAAVAASRK